MNKRKYYKTGNHRILCKDGKVRTYNYKPSNWKKKKQNLERKGNYYIPKQRDELIEEETFFPQEEEFLIYRSTFTFLYNEKRGMKRKEELRIWIYTEKPTITEADLEQAKNRFLESQGMNIPMNKVTGKELNAELEKTETLKDLNIYHCRFLLDDKEKITEEFEK